MWGPGQAVTILGEKRLILGMLSLHRFFLLSSSLRFFPVTSYLGYVALSSSGVEVGDLHFGMMRQDFIQPFKRSVFSHVFKSLGFGNNQELISSSICSVVILPLTKLFEDKTFHCRTNSSPFTFMPNALPL